MGTQSDTVDQILARIAGPQHGVVTRSQLLAGGVSARQVHRRLCNGSLLGVHPGVYRVGHRAPSTEATYLAAVFACGPGAVLSGRAAGWLLGLLKGSPPPPEVTAPGRRQVAGIKTGRSRFLSRPETTSYRGVPVTAVPRTLVDLAGVLGEEQLARACHEADVLHRIKRTQVEAALTRRPRAAGAAALRRILRGDVHVVLSKLERAFLRLLQASALPLPRTNRPAGGYWVDCRWPDYRLTVELDSYRYHCSRHAWEHDHRREREAYARGDAFRRYTWGDVFEHPHAMLRELTELLG